MLATNYGHNFLLTNNQFVIKIHTLELIFTSMVNQDVGLPINVTLSSNDNGKMKIRLTCFNENDKKTILTYYDFDKMTSKDRVNYFLKRLFRTEVMFSYLDHQYLTCSITKDFSNDEISA